jgi:hypothetical protein
MSRAISRSRGYGVTELTDGRFRARANLPPDDNGQRRQRTRIVASNVEADQWAQELLVSERRQPVRRHLRRQHSLARWRRGPRRQVPSRQVAAAAASDASAGVSVADRGVVVAHFLAAVY